MGEVDEGAIRLNLSNDAENDLRRRFGCRVHPTNEPNEGDLPVVLVDVERLTGYQPDNDEHKDSIRDSLERALFDDSEKGHERLAELLQTGRAFHSDTTTTQKNSKLLILHYPECIGPLSTLQMWRALQLPSSVPVVERLMDHLRVCNRPLVWKYEIQRELNALVATQERQKLLLEWKGGRRLKELNQLYMARETIHHRHELALTEQTRLEEERELRVEAELGMAPGTTSISEFFIGDDETDDEYFEPYRPCDLGDDGEKSQSENVEENRDEVINVELETSHDPEKVIDKARMLREKFATHALRKATAKTMALAKRLEQVDDLLESLQEEEWADEEGASGDELEDDFDEGASTLHAVLAMVLGALDFNPEDPVKHAQQLHGEHSAIVQEWKDHFGELPPPLPTKQTMMRTERERLGIEDNDDEAWDV